MRCHGEPVAVAVIVTYSHGLSARATAELLESRNVSSIVISTDQRSGSSADTSVPNIGYGSAVNFAVRKMSKQNADAPWLLVFNDDLQLTPDWLDSLLPFLSTTPPPTGIVALNGWSEREVRFQDAGRVPHGSAFAMRLQLFKAVGGFDTRYFMYGEEVDLALRAGQLSAIEEFAQNGIIHEGAASTGATSDAMEELGFSTRLLVKRHSAHPTMELALAAGIYAAGSIRRGRLMNALRFCRGIAFSRNGSRRFRRQVGAASDSIRAQYGRLQTP